MPQSAVQLFVLRDADKPLSAVLEDVASAGFDGVEFAYRLPEADVDAVVETLEQTGLEVAGAHVAIEELTETLRDRVATDDEEEETDEGGEDDHEPVADERVSFEDFQELDVRVGEIEVADPIEDSDDLARLEVDLGVETRQLVAGIQQLHDVDALPGTRVVVLANLEPAELFGVESNGMLLAAGEDADLLSTHGDSQPGTTIR